MCFIINWCEFGYGQCGVHDVYGNHKTINLFIASTEAKLAIASSSIVIYRTMPGKSIMLMSDVGNSPKVTKWLDGVFRVLVHRKVRRVSKTNIAHMSVKWNVSELKKEVNLIRVIGNCSNKGQEQQETIYCEYTVRIIKSNSNAMEESTVFKSEKTTQVKVICETDAINVTGAEPGENIKVYTASRVEVKAVVANDDALNIKLPTNQIYIVNAGQERYKVAL